MVTAPMITIRMEITIATIGRLMKNFDITRLLSYSLRIYRRTGPDFEEAVGDHALARL
jgi:hypothetical protein